MLRAKQVAEKLGIPLTCNYELTAQGELPCFRIGIGRGAIRHKNEDTKEYLKSCKRTEEHHEH